MPRAMFTLRIEMGDPISPEFHDEVLNAPLDPHEDLGDAALRVLGGYLQDAENDLNALLPEGMYAKIEGGKIQ